MRESGSERGTCGIKHFVAIRVLKTRNGAGSHCHLFTPFVTDEEASKLERLCLSSLIFARKV